MVVKLDFGLGMLAAAERNLPLGDDRLVGVDHGWQLVDHHRNPTNRKPGLSWWNSHEDQNPY